MTAPPAGGFSFGKLMPEFSRGGPDSVNAKGRSWGKRPSSSRGEQDGTIRKGLQIPVGHDYPPVEARADRPSPPAGSLSACDGAVDEDGEPVERSDVRLHSEPTAGC